MFRPLCGTTTHEQLQTVVLCGPYPDNGQYPHAVRGICRHVLFCGPGSLAGGGRVLRGFFWNNHSRMDDCLLAYAHDSQDVSRGCGKHGRFARARPLPGALAGQGQRIPGRPGRGKDRQILWGSAGRRFMGGGSGGFRITPKDEHAPFFSPAFCGAFFCLRNGQVMSRLDA